MVTLNGHGADYRGLSTDNKPTDAAINSIFFELETSDTSCKFLVSQNHSQV